MGDSNPCCVCGKEIPVHPNEVRWGYCSEECWQAWLEEHKDDTILIPYVPLQVTKIDMGKKS